MTIKTILLPVEGGIAHSTSPAGIITSASYFKRVFDDTSAEKHRWQFSVPENYTGSPHLLVSYAMTSATSGSALLTGRVISTGSDVDIDAAGFDTDNSLLQTVPGGAGSPEQADIELTSNCSMAIEDVTLIEFERTSTNASDSATGDVELLAAKIQYGSA